MSQTYVDFKCTIPGLIINTNYPHLGASPDGIVNCKCCGKGLLEIKCPFSVKDLHPARQTDKVTFLSASGKLKRSHKYYTQVQGQLSIADKLYCDFFVWTPKGYLMERIYPNASLWEKIVPKLTEFFVHYLLPEIMTRNIADGNANKLLLDSDSDKENVYCICRSQSSGRMIACDNHSCNNYQWFHYRCVGIRRAPAGTWYCPQCKKNKSK